MNLNRYDVVVIGSGPGGFTAAVRAAQIGAKVAIVEKSFVGGTCLNCGCISTKFLWQSLKTKQKIQKSYEYGFKATLEPVVFEDIVSRKNKNIVNIRKGMEIILSSYNISVLNGSASFKDKNTLIVLNNEKNEESEIYGDKIIIASGTKPSIVKDFIFDGNKIISSTDALNLREIPKNMLIIGGGVIGIEMATIFAGFSCQITLAECADSLLPNENSEISEEIRKNLSRQGVEVITACTNALDNISKYEKVLIVTGRTPNSTLGLNNLEINTIGKGFIETNEFCQTNIDNVYAVGDIAGKNLLACSAQNEGAAAAENAVKGNIVAVSNLVVPQVVFAIPQSSSVKVSDFSKYKNIIFGKFPFTANGRAFIENERAGFVKCAVDKLTEKPLAFWIIGAHSDEIVNTASQILKSGIKHISRETMFHPSLSESLLNAYEDAFGKCTEIAAKK
ncbi:MAG: NAD(P)/FAD-dependent oxidoreductase [Endomicrobium sp.]|jgi:dihydrolipoamide dehydrogenase|nr:NAD(P)/FAD-dependent oxidoreductase [Endomicrobium sp.]